MIAKAAAFTAGEAARATSARLIGDAGTRFSGISTDSRDDVDGMLYVALKGESFDGHNFTETAIAKGAKGILVSQPPALAGPVPILVVQDTLRALGMLARAHARRFRRPTIAVTGSNGKTTTKELIAAILETRSPVLKTQGNLNNLIGLPMTLLGLEEQHRVCVVEMGMNAPGEIAAMAEIAEPDVGIVTNIGPAHVGMLGSMEAVADAKGELYRGLKKPHSVAVVNLDDPLVKAQAAGKPKQRGFGTSAGADVRLVEAAPEGEGQKIRLAVRELGELSVLLPLPGHHNALNAAGAVAACTALIPGVAPLDLETIARGLSSVAPLARRLHFEALGEWLVVDDCYNANSASMLAALETVGERAKRENRRLVALLGEMRELGTYAEAEHKKVGDAAVARGAKLVAAFGKDAAPIAAQAKAGGVEARHVDSDVDALWSWISSRLEPGDVILVKGSRGSKMERFLERMGQAQGGAH